MPRPPEYENLIETKAFEAVQPTQGAVPGYLKNAGDYQRTFSSAPGERNCRSRNAKLFVEFFTRGSMRIVRA